MKKLLLLSGKGGTGKTTTAGAFIRFSKTHNFADCDVDAPNLHIIQKLKSEPEIQDYYGLQTSSIDTSKCISCGKCIDNCRFNAITKGENGIVVNVYSCEGCGVCSLVCPTGAVTLNDTVVGNTMLYNDEVTFSTAKLKMGSGNSGKLVTQVKNNLTNNATSPDIAIIDGSPGIGCPIIASITGVDMALIIVDPSLSALHDLKRIVSTTMQLETKVAVAVNKWDTYPEGTKQIVDYCQKNDIMFLGRIPYDKNVSLTINNGQSIADMKSEATEALFNIYKKVIKII